MKTLVYPMIVCANIFWNGMQSHPFVYASVLGYLQTLLSTVPGLIQLERMEMHHVAHIYGVNMQDRLAWLSVNVLKTILELTKAWDNTPEANNVLPSRNCATNTNMRGCRGCEQTRTGPGPQTQVLTGMEQYMC